MSEEFRLVFSGEVQEGQHPAVVKKRLSAVLKLDDERMGVLFSGKAVVVKKATDAKTAARYQEAFNKAGARLRVLPSEEASVADVPKNESTAPESPAQASSQPAAPQPTPPQPAPPQPAPPQPEEEPNDPSATAAGGLGVLPVGSDMLNPDEREAEQAVDVSTDHLSVQGSVFTVPDDDVDAPPAPDVDHISLADLGAELGNAGDTDVVVQEIEADFDLAEVGAVIGSVDNELKAAAVDMDQVDFDLAAPGADMADKDEEPPPPAPDTSHIELDKDT